jgi:hypothetical protein
MALALGRTAEEIEQGMTARELTEWAAWEGVNGPVLVHERVEAAGAILATVVARTAGNRRARPRDFLPRWDRRGDLDAAWEAFVRNPPRAGD